MERFSRANADLRRDGSKAISMYSVGSNSTRTTGYRNSSADSSSSRPTSYTPSYMNAAVPARKPAPLRTASSQQQQPLDAGGESPPSRRTPSTSTATTTTNNVRKGSLLLFVADAIHPSTLPYLETMLRRGNYGTIALVGAAGAREPELKALKIRVYALLGKLSHSSVGVEVRVRERWDEDAVLGVVEEVLAANGRDEPVQGVLCEPGYGGGEETTQGVLALGGEALRAPWEGSVGFLQGVAKAAVPHMRAAGGLFAVTGPTARTPVSAFYKSACETLIELLAEDAATAGVAIVHAENVLVPEPESEPRPQSHQQHHADEEYARPSSTNGIPVPSARHAQGGYSSSSYDPPDGFAPSESPTKLWNMWALHEQLGAD